MSRRRARRPQPTTDQRTSEQRLEALVREPNRDRSKRMVARIRSDLNDSRDPEPWIAGARTLGERLIISDDSLYYFAELFTEYLIFAASETDPELSRIEREIAAIERAHGARVGESWLLSEGPPEWRRLTEDWDRRADDI